MNLPLACMNQTTGRRIGSTVGEEMVNTGADRIGWGESLRVRILIDPSKTSSMGENVKGARKIKMDCVSIRTPSKILLLLRNTQP